jgi:periplasmic copper chaperone A
LLRLACRHYPRAALQLYPEIAIRVAVDATYSIAHWRASAALRASSGNIMSFPTTLKFIALCALFFPATSAFSHITLEQAQAETGAYYKATLRVGHGCEGLPTTAVRVQLPAGFQGGKPMPKTGWTLQAKTEKLATPYDNHGKPITEDITEITWTAKAPEFALKDSEYDEFILRGRAAMPAGAAWFKVTQLCQDGSKTGSNPWTEIPAQGTSTRGLKYPAALLNVTAPTTATSSAKPAPGTGHKH